MTQGQTTADWEQQPWYKNAWKEPPPRPPYKCGPRPARPDGLSEREIEVIILITDGWSNKEIAVILDISAKTVNTHRERILEKLGHPPLAQLVKWAVKKGIAKL